MMKHYMIVLNDLFFPVKESALLVNNFPVGKYFALTEQETGRFLGIKGERQKYIPNVAAYQKSGEVYRLLTGSPGEAFHWWMNDEKNQFSVTIAGLRVDEFAKRFKNEVLHRLEEKSLKEKVNSGNEISMDFQLRMLDSQNHELELFIDAKLTQLDLSVAFVNGYDIDHSCNLYLILRWIDNDARIKYLAISRKNINVDSRQMAKDFREDLMSFVITSFLRVITPLEKRFIRPLLFNIHNKNFDATTLKNDDQYRNKLVYFNRNTLSFIENLAEKDCNYYALTEYIIRTCYFYEGEKENLKVKNKEAVITVNETYQNSLSRLNKLYSNENTRKDFEFSNFHKLENVEYLLREQD